MIKANLIILILIFAAGIFLVLAALFNAKFLFDRSHGRKTETKSRFAFLNLMEKTNRSRGLYMAIGIFIILLGIVAIFNGFLNEPIDF